MAIPDFQSIMRPLLAEYADGEEQRIVVARERLADEFGLTAAEREERLPSGVAKKFPNRVGWAVTYLFGTGLLDRPRRGVYRMTARGRMILDQNPERIDLSVLSQFPELAEMRGKRQKDRPIEPAGLEPVSQRRSVPAFGQFLCSDRVERGGGTGWHRGSRSMTGCGPRSRP